MGWQRIKHGLKKTTGTIIAANRPAVLISGARAIPKRSEPPSERRGQGVGRGARGREQRELATLPTRITVPSGPDLRAERRRTTPATSLHDDAPLLERRPVWEDSLSPPLGHLVHPEPVGGALPSQPVPEQRLTSPKFLPHAYLDRGGQLNISSAVTHLLRRIFLPLNSFIVVMGGILGLVGGLTIGYLNPPLGILFSLLIFYGAFVQGSAFDYKRVYGIWRGLCPHCEDPLNINASAGIAKTARCSCCASLVVVKDGTFRTVPWYTQLL